MKLEIEGVSRKGNTWTYEVLGDGYWGLEDVLSKMEAVSERSRHYKLDRSSTPPVIRDTRSGLEAEIVLRHTFVPPARKKLIIGYPGRADHGMSQMVRRYAESITK